MVEKEEYGAHKPVLLTEVIEALNIRENGMYLDTTYGTGGHSRAILERLGKEGRLFATDRDPNAKQFLIEDPRFEWTQQNFADIGTWAQQRGFMNQFNGVLADLGVSSPQLDNAPRGFSFMRDGPLDMRMNPQQGESAAQWLNRAPAEELIRVLKDYGEERYAGRIARAIIANRPLNRTLELAALIAATVPSVERHKNPATRTFQAIRMHVNKEPENLSAFLASALDLLAPQGRLAVISFHSVEDRIVKRFIREQAEGPRLPRHMPLIEEFQPRLRKVGKAVKPGEQEVQGNSRARSAVLRVAEKCA